MKVPSAGANERQDSWSDLVRDGGLTPELKQPAARARQRVREVRVQGILT